MDLARRQARWVTVEAVITSPDATHERLSQPARAWYEVGARPGERIVTVPGHEVERVLFADRTPVDGSFSDFVWVFDATTGHVVSASLSGSISEPIRLGPLRTAAEVSIEILVSTRISGGYQPPHRIAGKTVIGYCADPSLPDCHPVPIAAYDRASGWVRSAGAVCASWRSLRTLAYTSLGQARFTERPRSGHGSSRVTEREGDGTVRPGARRRPVDEGALSRRAARAPASELDETAAPTC